MTKKISNQNNLCKQSRTKRKINIQYQSKNKYRSPQEPPKSKKPQKAPNNPSQLLKNNPSSLKPTGDVGSVTDYTRWATCAPGAIAK